jgi:hypothetical protein
LTKTWTIDPEELTAVLEELGFDVEQADAALPEGGWSLTARQETGNRAVLVRTDAGGRLQVLVTEQLADEAAAPLKIANVHLTITDTTIRRRTLRGTVRDINQFRLVVESITRIEESREPPPV